MNFCYPNYLTIPILCVAVIVGTNAIWPADPKLGDVAPIASLAEQPNGAVFTRVGTVYTGLAYGHVVMRYNLTSLTHRTEQLEEIWKFFQHVVIPKKATMSDRYFLAWTKTWMKNEIQETVDKVNEALHPIKHTKRRRRRRRKRQVRRRRQVVIGLAAATLGAIAGSVITQFSNEGVNDVLENKENVLATTVKDNLIQLNQDTRDIKNLKETLRLVVNDTQRYLLDAKRNTYGVTHLQTVVTIQQACRSLRDATDTIESARIGEFLPSMVDHKGLVQALKELRSKAVRQGYEVSIETSMDMKHLPCTTVVQGDTLHVIIHIPLYHTALDLDLFWYVDHPIQKMDHGLFASIDVEGGPTFLGINRDESKYKEFNAGELESCYQRNKRYFCPDVPLYSKSRPNCLWGLYKNHEAQVKDYCPITLTRMVAKAVRVDENRFMITDTDDKNELTLSCGTNVPTRGKINGTKIIHVAKGC